GKISESDVHRLHKDNIHKSYASLDTGLTVDPNLISPMADPICKAVYPGLTGAYASDEASTVITITKLLVDGFAGAGSISLGGFDYHTNDRSTGELADFRAGQMMGYALELAARKGKDLFLYVFSDGAQNSGRGMIDNSLDGRGKLAWNVDSGTHAASFV